MFRLEGGTPGDTRGFLHKSFIGRAVGGAVKRFVGATPVGQAVQFATSLVRPPTRPVAPRTTTARPSLQGAEGKEFGRRLKLGNGPAPFQEPVFTTIGPRGPATRPRPITNTPRPMTFNGANGFCDFPKVRDAEGRCRTPTSGALGGEQFGVGEAVMGRYGAALEPGSMIIDRAVCLRGMQLGNDGLCYNKGAITNSQRQWPRGRRPLLTGGDMRAIGIAARAGSKLERTTKRLRALGMMKALPKGRAAAHAHAKPVAAVSVRS